MAFKYYVVLAVLCIYTYHHRSSSFPMTLDDIPLFKNQGCGECERVYAPVCASDNKTYLNECKMNCLNYGRLPEAKAKVKRIGPCILGQRRNIIGSSDEDYNMSIERFNVSMLNLTLLQDYLRQNARQKALESFSM